MTTMYARWMITRDLPAVLAIEAATGGDWDRDEFLRRLRHRNCIGKVVEVGESLVGYVVWHLDKTRLTVARLCGITDAAAALLAADLAQKAKGYRRRLVKTKPRVLRLAPGWRTATVAALLANPRTPAPILADALEDAGCDNPGLLSALRADGALGLEARGMVAAAG